MAMTIVEADHGVVGGVDTHLDFHVAAALGAGGALLGVEWFNAAPEGYAELLGWMSSFGTVAKVGVEGAGAYGAGLTRFLHGAGVEVIDVEFPSRQTRRKRGKSDPTDAVEAARAAHNGKAQAHAKTRNGHVEAIRALLVAKRSARHARVKALNQIRQLAYTAPDAIRQRLKGVSTETLAGAAVRLRPRPSGDPVTLATTVSIGLLGRRVLALDAELARIEALLAKLVAATAPGLLAVYGVGTDTAAALLVTAGDNPERIRSEAAWAHLCGVSPIEASSGKVVRHRLNRGGNRQANSALWRIVMTRLSNDPRTRAYMERRTKEGLSKLEVIRVLKRYVAREVYRHLPRG
jgi:transposase